VAFFGDPSVHYSERGWNLVEANFMDVEQAQAPPDAAITEPMSISFGVDQPDSAAADRSSTPLFKPR
jgi:hypothetical protein